MKKEQEIEELYNEINNAIAKCDKCEDCEFYGDKGDCQNKRIAKALIGLGYHKTEVKTNGDYIRKRDVEGDVKSDEELANLYWAGRWDDNTNKPYFISTITHSRYDTSEDAYKANLEYLKQEYKEK